MQSKRAYSQAQATQPIRVRLYPPQQPIAAPIPRRAAPPPQQNGYHAPQPVPYANTRPMPRPAQPPTRKAQHSNKKLYLFLAAGVAAFVLMSCAMLTLGVGIMYGHGILPGVHAGGIALGGLSQTEAAQKLASEWSAVRLTDGQRAWRYNATDLGLSMDANATSKAAYEQGRSNLGNALSGLIGHVDTQPVVNIDATTLQNTLTTNADQFAQPAVNAGVKLVNGNVTTTPPQNGRIVDVAATVAQVQQNPGAALANGRLALVMRSVAPSVTDSSPMVEQAKRLLSSPLDVRIYDPITGDSVYWSAPPEQWGNWLSADPDPSSPTGLALTANDTPVRDYLTAQSGVLDATRYLDMDEAVANVQQAIREGRTNPYARVYHHDRQYVVQPGETITSIAWDVGEPYLYIQQANGDLQSVSVGQSITIPSPDTFLPNKVDPDKRIVVSISKQRTQVFENGNLKWDWATSTGIPDSPTWPGVYQIISHEPNAYAGNWDLWMPHFMGVYQPIPGSDFTNGFHGFPTRGGWQLLWTNSLGTKVTYGCILLSNENAEALYNWAEEGVVVEIQSMKSEQQPTQVSWRVLLPLLIIGVIVKLAYPSISTWVIAGLVIFGVVVVYRKVFIRGFVNGLNRGRANPYLFTEEYEKAAEFATEQIAKHPKDIVARLTRSTAYIYMGNLEAACADCEAALALDPKSVYTLNNRAVISMQQDNLPAALADMQQALSLQPDNPVLLYGRGAAYARMDNLEAAQKDFDDAIEVDPDQAITYIGRGCLAFNRGDLAAALADFQKARELSPVTHQFNAALAVAEFATGDVETAQKRWQALPTRYTHYDDPDWQRRVLCWPEAMTQQAGKLGTAQPTTP